jgi:hypothetical protein
MLGPRCISVISWTKTERELVINQSVAERRSVSLPLGKRYHLKKATVVIIILLIYTMAVAIIVFEFYGHSGRK